MDMSSGATRALGKIDVDHRRWRQIDEVFCAAVERPREDRGRFLDDVCGGDSVLRREVEGLLEADSERGPLDDPLLHLSTAASAAETDPMAEGQQIGPYKVLRQLGRGGMGVVYLAERDDGAYRQQVAIKVMQQGGEIYDRAHRFRTERQILAGLEHPNIARLYDGGATEDGRLYLVMEYVDGLPIDVYCDRHRLTIEARLGLFRQVCLAVHHAHQNLLVHRDLKPDNVLVTADGVVKLLDFGIAKSLEARHDEPAMVTRTGLRLMTPTFASPEQVRGEAVTTATDVYALGVLLYVLLAGVSPYRLRKNPPGELERRICEQEPEAPSAAFERIGRPGVAGVRRGSPVTLGEVCQARRQKPGELRRRLRGDLDNVVLMALRKEPQRRYSSAGQLAGDVRRHLDALPVTARRDTLRYRLAKLLRRHRLLAAAAAVVALLVVGFLAVMALQSVRLARQKEIAERQRDKAEQALDLMVDVFAASDSLATGARPATARELLNAGALEVRSKKIGPEVRATLMAAIGEVYLTLGHYEEAAALLPEAYELRRQALGPEHPEVAASLCLLAGLHQAKGEHRQAEALYRRALALQERLAVAELEQAGALAGLAAVLERQGEYDQAESLLRRVLAIHSRELGAESAEVAGDLQQLGLLLEDSRHEYAEAEELLRRSLAIRRGLLGGQHPKVATVLDSLAGVLRLQSKFEEAEALLLEAFEIAQAVLDEDHPVRITTLNNLATVRLEMGDFAGAAHSHRELLRLKRQKLDDDHPKVLVSKHNLGMALRGLGRLAEAEQLFREVLASRRRTLGEPHPKVGLSLYSLGEAVLERGGVDEAEQYFRQSLSMLRGTLAEGHVLISSPLYGLGKTALARGAPDAALALLEEALAIRRAAVEPGHWRIAQVRLEIGAALVALERHGEALPLLRSSHETMAANFAASHRNVELARERLERATAEME